MSTTTLPQIEIISAKPRFIRPVTAAEILGLSTTALAIMRTRNQGPKFYRLGRRIVYDQHELVAWVKSNGAEFSLGQVEDDQ